MSIFESNVFEAQQKFEALTVYYIVVYLSLQLGATVIHLSCLYPSHVYWNWIHVDFRIRFNILNPVKAVLAIIRRRIRTV